GQFDAATFLEHTWQQQPCLLRGLLPNFRDPISPDELAGLACEEDVESRLVSRHDDGWRARFGPFEEAEFQSLPESGWSLLVQAVDLWLPEVAALSHGFGFIPAWRREDVMVSFATDGGGVGPHFDHYDVFLVQGMGRRRWRIGPPCTSESALEDNPELRLLKDFQAREEHVLTPGDVLYIPPGYGHWGESMGDSLCYSVGFRAPSASDAMLGYADFVAAGQEQAKRYRDPSPVGFGQAGEISQKVISQLQALIIDGFPDCKPYYLRRWFGCHVTAPRDPSFLVPPELELTTLTPGQGLRPYPATRLAWTQDGDHTLLFCNGQHYSLPGTAAEELVQLCAVTVFTVRENSQLVSLLTELVNSGALELVAATA
ncbi:MAG: cupin domain-containing protein, partial [Gammaproteobacteria bacterium]